MSEDRVVIGFDVDGVILNYFEGLMIWAEGLGHRIGCSPEEVDTYTMAAAFPDLSEDEIIDLFKRFNTVPDFGRLRPYAGALETISALLGDYPELELVAITSAGRSEETIRYRLENLASIPFSEVHVIQIGESKRSHLERLPRGSLYIDDLEHHALAGDEAGLTSVLYRQPYNRDIPHPRAVEGWEELGLLIREHLGPRASLVA